MRLHSIPEQRLALDAFWGLVSSFAAVVMVKGGVRGGRVAAALPLVDCWRLLVLAREFFAFGFGIRGILRLNRNVSRSRDNEVMWDVVNSQRRIKANMLLTLCVLMVVKRLSQKMDVITVMECERF